MVSFAGSRIVEMIWEDLKPTDILTRSAIMNGIAAYMALGGSTNAAIHLIAIAGRAGVELTLDDMAQVSARIPVLANLFPSGDNLMEDFYFAGGMKALLARIGEHLDLSAITVEGRTLGEAIAGAECWNDDVIRTPANPVIPIAKGRTLVLLRGNLAPDGAVIKTSAASPHLLRHEGAALVFDGPEDMRRRVDDPDLDVTADTILVLRGAGPVGAPGMPEWGNLQIPKKLQQKGVTDMVRISDGRMSGTHYGTCILHVAPESAVGGPLALLKTGDRIRLDAEAGTLDMLVDAEELDRRRREWSPPERYSRSFAALYQAHVSQADKGCDFDFLAGTAPVPEPEIF
jgi:dihydroxy-acid dehydratase